MCDEKHWRAPTVKPLHHPSIQDSEPDDHAVNRVFVTVASGSGTDYMDWQLPIKARLASNTALDEMVAVYGIFFGNASDTGFDQTFFNDYANETAGKIFTNVAPSDLPVRFAEIATLY